MKKRRRRISVPQRAKTAAGVHMKSKAASAVPPSLNLLRIVICGVLFASLVGMKLLLPGGLSGFRSRLGTWLARDADFAEAFSAIGRAVSGEESVKESLEDAYTSVFGQSEAKEVSLPAEIRQPDPEPVPKEPEAREYPERAAAIQHVLGFDYSSPLEGVTTSGFGWREDPSTGLETFHYGVDIAADEGTDITSFADGRVGIVGDSVELGKYLTVHHGNGIITLYAHCSSISVLSGEEVWRGCKLAEVGSTGNATGPHLHFEINDGEDYLDPAFYLS